MRTLPSDEKRLELLNHAQPGRPWRSCCEERRCIACDTTFAGYEVIVHWSRGGQSRLACPNCESSPALWVRAGNPLTDDEVWSDWEAAISLAAGDSDADEDLVAVS